MLDLKRNFISFGEFDNKGYVFKGEKGILRVMKGLKEVLRGCKWFNRYFIHKTRVKIELWHMRLVHVNERGLVELGKQNMLGGDKVEKLELCEPYVFGKTCRVKYNKGKKRTHGSLDYIHVDLWGPARNPSHSGGRYFLSIFDDYSREFQKLEDPCRKFDWQKG